MRAPRLALAITIGIILFWSTTAAPVEQPAQDNQDRPVMVNGRPTAAVHGVWRSRGYGYVVRITQDGPKLFHVAGDFCYADPRPESDPDELFVLYRSLGRDAVAFSTLPGQTLYVFDRLAGLPQACTEQARWTPPRIAALVAATFADLYPSFQERGIDWRVRTAAAERALNENSSAADLFETLRIMLSGIENPHVELHAEIAGKARDFDPGEAPTIRRARTGAGRGADPKTGELNWRRAYRRGVLNAVLHGKGHETANDRLFWGRVGDIGYLNFLSLAAFSDGDSSDTTALDVALDQAIAAFKGARAVIVDVSNNGGGFDGMGQRVAGRFADDRKLAYAKVAFGARDLEPQPFYVEPSRRARYLGPVYLLTSDVTVSAGETFTLFMRALPNVVHVGGTTRGAFSDMVDKPLPNGWKLTLSAEVYRDPQGRSYEARGIPPQVKRDVFPANDLNGGHARAVLALIDDIRRNNMD